MGVILTGTLTAVKAWFVASTGDGRPTFAFPDQTPGTTPGQTGLSGLTALSVGGTGEKTRTRDCVGPVHGGLECPSPNETETDSCDAPACWTEFSEWSACEACAEAPGVSPGADL